MHRTDRRGIVYNYCMTVEDVDGRIHPDEHRISATLFIYVAKYNRYFRRIVSGDLTEPIVSDITFLFK
jgi:hypothetical protein